MKVPVGPLPHNSPSDRNNSVNESERNPIGVVSSNSLRPHDQFRPNLVPSTQSLQKEQAHLQYSSSIDSLNSSSSTSSLLSSASHLSTTTTNTSVSLSLNPNSSVDNADLSSIALLKEIFPHESTESLRELHYQHLMKTKSSMSDDKGLTVADDAHIVRNGENEIIPITPENMIGPLELSGPSEQNEVISSESNHSAVASGRLTSTRKLFTNIPKVELPDDFLRLPKSVAVLRTNNAVGVFHGDFNEKGGKNKSNDVANQARYVFVSELESQAMQEYHLALHSMGKKENRGHSVEYLTVVVDKDPRWGLGMTLQDNDTWMHRQERKSGEPTDRSPSGYHQVAIPFGLQVVGFLPDPEKIKRGDVVTSISRSPAEDAGVKLNDVLIGINGSAFLLPPQSELHLNSELYKFQKERIIHSIQKSPNPVVVHIRRRHRPGRFMPSGPPELASPGGPSSSLLDNTFLGDVEDDAYLPDENLATASSSATPQRQPDLQQPALLEAAARSGQKQTQPLPDMSSSLSISYIHPLAKALTQRKLISSIDDQTRITRRLQHFTERTRQWESSNSLQIFADPTSFGLVPCFDPNDLPPDMAELMTFSSSQDEQDDDDQESYGSHPSVLDLVDRISIGGQSQQSEHLAKSHSQIKLSFTPSTPPLTHNSPLIPMEYLRAFYGDEQARRIASLRTWSGGYDGIDRERSVSKESSSNAAEYPGWRLLQRRETAASKSGSRAIMGNEKSRVSVMWIPLHGIRKSLSARIVNCFVEEVMPVENDQNRKTAPVPRMAYTMWVYDVETGREWYAPIRYWKDFCDLREAALALLPPSCNLHQEISSLKLPKEPTIPSNSLGWGAAVFGSRLSPLSPLQERRRQKQSYDFEEARNETCRVLEEFLRELIGTIYTCEPLNPVVAEIALYVQSFLGVEAGMMDNALSTVMDHEFNSIVEREQDRTRQLLKRSIQRYIWRIFLLHTMKAIVRDFVDGARTRGPKLQDIESLEAQGRTLLKRKAMDELETIQTFLDHLVDLLLDGCSDDLRSVADRREYSPIRKLLSDPTYWDRLVRESIREQVEIEVYVPLRGVVSRLLVNGWRHEDMEVKFKIKVSCTVLEPSFLFVFLRFVLTLT